LGRYSQAGQGQAVLTGKRGDQEARYAFEINLPESHATYSFLPRLWASRKIGYLLEQIRLKGETPELAQSVKTLAEKFGIVTPYTSYFAAPPDVTGPPAQLHIGASPPSGCPTCMTSMLQGMSGQTSVQFSQRLEAMKEGYTAHDEVFTNYDSQSGEIFQFDTGVWKPAGYTSQPTIKVKFNSDAYYWLAQHSNLHNVLKLGKRVIVPVQGQYIEITAEDESQGLSQTQELTQALGSSGINLGLTQTPEPEQTPANYPSGTSGVNENSGSVSETPEPSEPDSRPNNWWIAVGALALVLSAGLAFWWLRR
jgi:Ca-activated chloride channel family protein